MVRICKNFYEKGFSMKEMKKQLSLVLSIFMLLTCFVPASALAKDNKQVRRDEGTSLAEQPYEKDDFFISGVKTTNQTKLNHIRIFCHFFIWKIFNDGVKNISSTNPVD